MNTTELERIWYDGKRNLGIAEQKYLGTPIKTYSYYGLGELLTIVDKKYCEVSALKEGGNITPFFGVKDKDGQLHIETSLTHAFGSDTVNIHDS